MRILRAAAAVMAAAAMLVSSVASAGALSFKRGDSDGDGIVTIMDATEIQLVIAEIKDDPYGMIALRGGVIGDGLTILDATAIQRYLADLGNDYSIGSMQIDDLIMPTDENQLPILT